MIDFGGVNIANNAVIAGIVTVAAGYVRGELSKLKSEMREDITAAMSPFIEKLERNSLDIARLQEVSNSRTEQMKEVGGRLRDLETHHPR